MICIVQMHKVSYEHINLCCVECPIKHRTHQVSHQVSHEMWTTNSDLGKAGIDPNCENAFPYQRFKKIGAAPLDPALLARCTRDYHVCAQATRKSDIFTAELNHLPIGCSGWLLASFADMTMARLRKFLLRILGGKLIWFLWTTIHSSSHEQSLFGIVNK